MLSATVGFSVVAFILGWDFASAYFGACGAQWVLPHLSPFNLLELSWYSALMAAPLSLPFVAVSADSLGRKYTVGRRFQAVWYVVALGGFGVGLVSDLRGYQEVALVAYLVAGTTSASLAAFNVLDALAAVAKREPGLRHTGVLSILVAVGFVHLAAMSLGSSEGRSAFSESRSQLAFARLVDGEYRLVLVSSDLALLARLTSDPRGTHLRFVPLESIEEIRGWRPPSKESRSPRAASPTPTKTSARR